MITAPLFALALAAQPPELGNFDMAVQCAATLKVATEGATGPYAQEAARQGQEFAKVAESLGRSLSRNVAERMGQYETALKMQRASSPAQFEAVMQSCRASAAIYFPPPAPPAEPASP